MATPHQIVSPQSNAVLIGLVQDSLVGGFLLTSQDTLYDESQVMQLLAQARHDPKSKDYLQMSMPSKGPGSGLWLDNLDTPAIIKPKRMWTGKQVMSALLPQQISFCKPVRNANADTLGILKDDVVIVRNGLHLAGRLCKATLGTSTAGFVQQIWKWGGPWAAAKFVSDAQRLLVYCLTQNTICISIRDTVQTEET